jgi:hypothetical protein
MKALAINADLKDAVFNEELKDKVLNVVISKTLKLKIVSMIKHRKVLFTCKYIFRVDIYCDFCTKKESCT